MCAHWLIVCAVLVSANGIAPCIGSVGTAQYKFSWSADHTQYTSMKYSTDWGLGDQVL